MYPTPEVISLDIWHTLIKPNQQFKALQIELFADFFAIQPNLDFENIVRQVEAQAYQASLTGKDTNFEERIGQIAHKLLVTNLPMHQVEKLYVAMEEIFLQHPPVLIEPNLLDTLQAIRHKNIAICLISNTGFIKGQTMRKFLANIELLPQIDIAIFSNEWAICKPHPSIFAPVAQQATSHAKVWHIGDSYEADYLGAENIGFQPFLLQNSKHTYSFAKDLSTTPSIQFLLSYL